MKTNKPSEKVKHKKPHELALFIFSDGSGLNHIYFYDGICQLPVLSGFQCYSYNK